MTISNGVIKALSLAAVTAGALLLSQPAFAWRGGGGHGGGWHGGGWRGGGWGYGGWGYPYYGWGWGPGWGWGDGYYYAAPVYTQCYIRRVHVHTRHGWRWRRVRYCYQ